MTTRMSLGLTVQRLMNPVVAPYYKIKAMIQPDITQEQIDDRICQCLKALTDAEATVQEVQLFVSKHGFSCTDAKLENVLGDIDCAIDQVNFIRNNNHYA